jgi:hypothetical protein
MEHKPGNGACEVSEDLIEAALDEPETPDLETMGMGSTPGPIAPGPQPYQQPPAGGGGSRLSAGHQLVIYITLAIALFNMTAAVIDRASGFGAKGQRINDRLDSLETEVKETKAMVQALNTNQDEPAPAGPRLRARSRKIKIPPGANLLKPQRKDYGFADGHDGGAASPNQ